MEEFSRTRMLIGQNGLEKLSRSSVAVFGIGGVGSFAAEALIRAGLGKITLVDNDVITLSNINRQIHALHSTAGKLKTDVMKARLLDINPHAAIECIQTFYLPRADIEALFTWEYDYIIDAVDTVSAKLGLVKKANQCAIPIISAMGTGNKMEGAQFFISDIYETKNCPLAKVMRKELRKCGIKSLKVVSSMETPIKPQLQLEDTGNTKRYPGSISFVPPISGLLLAGEVVKHLIS